ncbi:MAG: gamma-glutamyl-gamma-aminobutyrate hydrolase family protein [Ectothiorhodospiraceae bacterium]|nr:gamma-glutamyl-gamma-aminobutyrate hydrolase family protein [Ectothiorhodospiraceae bacterium]
MSDHHKPLVAIVASVLEVSERRYPAHATGAKNVDAVARFADAIPMILPALGPSLELADVVSRIDGLVLTGGRANVEPHHYGGPPFPDDEPIDPARDATALPLVRACIDAAVPIFGICRGIQEMNVALGGSLHYRVHMVPGKDDHRMPRHPDVTMEEIFKLRHPVALTPGGLFERLVGASEVVVNSLHGQGIDRLADDLAVEAISPDGVIEGVRLRDDRTFTVGVQWHAEWRPDEHALGRALFSEFGAAARARSRARTRGAGRREATTTVG